MTDHKLHDDEASQAIDGIGDACWEISDRLIDSLKSHLIEHNKTPTLALLPDASIECFVDVWCKLYDRSPSEYMESLLGILESRFNLSRDELVQVAVERLTPSEVFTTGQSPQELLDKLADETTPESQRWDLILQAEVTSFDDEQIEELCQLLYVYILEKRDSSDTSDLVAVASAIRKLAANIRLKDLSRLSDVLSSEHVAPIPLEIELEVAKVIVRKLSQTPPDADDSERELSDRLMELVQTYLKPRLLSRQLYGATALNAVLAILLLRANHTQEVVRMLVELPSIWFLELVARRASRLREQLLSRFSPKDFESYSKGLDAVLNAISQGQS